MEEEQYTLELEAMLKEMRINFNRKANNLLPEDTGNNYQRPPMRPYSFLNPPEDNVKVLTFVVNDDVTKEECEAEDISIYMPRSNKNGEPKEYNNDCPKLFIKEVKDMTNISTHELYFVKTNDGVTTSVVMIKREDNALKLISPRPDLPDIEILVDDIDTVYEIIHCKF